MPTTLVLPDDYGRVLASTVAVSSLSVLHYFHTGLLRRTANVPYPNAYVTADEAAKDPAKYRFNCAQRAQANFTENVPPMLVGTLIAGLKYPQAASTLAMVWIASRVLYVLWYTKKGTSAEDRGGSRRWGTWGTLVLWGTIGLAGWTSWELM